MNPTGINKIVEAVKQDLHTLVAEILPKELVTRQARLDKAVLEADARYADVAAAKTKMRGKYEQSLVEARAIMDIRMEERLREVERRNIELTELGAAVELVFARLALRIAEATEGGQGGGEPC